MFVAALATDHYVNAVFQVRNANVAYNCPDLLPPLSQILSSFSLHSCASSFNPVSSQLFLSQPQREDGQLEQNVRALSTELFWHPCSAVAMSFTFGHRFIGYSPQRPGAKAKETPQTVSKSTQTLKCSESSFKDEDLNSWRLRKRSHSNRWGLKSNDSIENRDAIQRTEDMFLCFCFFILL